MNRNHKMMLASIVSTVAAGVLIVTSTVQAKPPRSDAQIAQEQALLMQAVAKGDGLWHDGSLGTNGLACGNCHPDGSASNPHTFPKFQSNLGKVGTLRDMINWCIMVPMQGKALALDSDEMTAMEAYSTFTHRGLAIAPAKDEQHGAIPVAGGPGYPSQ
ncbi:MAG TPA: cytochrome C [Gammaproteobacteria bacterium]